MIKLLKRVKSSSVTNNVIIDSADDINTLLLKKVTGRIRRIGVGCRLYAVDFSGDIELGRFVSIWGPNIRILSRIKNIKIGSFCSIATNTLLINYNHRSNRPTTYFIHQNIFGESNMQKDIESNGPIILEEDVWVGANSVILGGVTLGRGSIIAAGSVVTKDIPPYSIVGGTPAKIIKSRFNKESIQLLEDSKWWTWSIDKLEQNKSFFDQILE